jgi:hypothetical protein
MLTLEENELLTRTGPGETPMGDLMLTRLDFSDLK